MSKLYEKWVQDMAGGQHPNGQLSVFAPTIKIPGEPFTTYAQGLSPIWSSALPEIAWRLYVQYGDKRVLETHYATVKLFAESLRAQELPGRPGIVTDAHSDWIPPDIVGTRPPEEPTIYGTAYYFRTLDLMARFAKALGKEEDAAAARAEAERIRLAFHREFYDPERQHYYGYGQASYRQSANAIPLHFGMADAEQREAIGKTLVADIAGHGGALNTGTVGARSMMTVLPTLGAPGAEAAWKLLTKTDYPSWGHMLKNGATTIWETWRGDSSLNHPAFGSVGGFLYEHLAGIEPSEEHPGFEEFDVKPIFPDDLGWVKTSYRSVRGEIAVAWRREGKQLILEVTVPEGSNARIVLPTVEGGTFTENNRAGSSDPSLPGFTVFRAASGNHTYLTNLP